MYKKTLKDYLNLKLPTIFQGKHKVISPQHFGKLTIFFPPFSLVLINNNLKQLR